VTANWLAAAMQAGERRVPPKDFTPDAVPATILPIYLGLGLAHSVWYCTFHGLVVLYI